MLGAKSHRGSVYAAEIAESGEWLVSVGNGEPRMLESQQHAAANQPSKIGAQPNAPLPSAPHAISVEAVLKFFGTDRKQGLLRAEVEEQRSRSAQTNFPKRRRNQWWRRFARQFADLLIWVLIAAALISGVLASGSTPSRSSPSSCSTASSGSCRRGGPGGWRRCGMSSPHAKVIRDGRLQNLPAADVVAGDRIDLEPGDRVPADVRLVDTPAPPRKPRSPANPSRRTRTTARCSMSNRPWATA